MLLALLFLLTALLYSAVGFGGGSTYNALLVLALEDVSLVPLVALACNIVVVSLGSWNFVSAGHVKFARAAPLFALSVPAAWLGGYLSLPAWLFVGLLAAALFVAGLLMLFIRPERQQRDIARRPSRAADLAAGAGLGLLAGMTGIGGGIYLAPLLYLRRWAPPPAIAGTAALFILVNSLAGLAGQLMKVGIEPARDMAQAHWPLLGAVLVGGAIGSRLGSLRIDPKWLRVGTALLILYVSVRLGLRFPAEWSRV